MSTLPTPLLSISRLSVVNPFSICTSPTPLKEIPFKVGDVMVIFIFLKLRTFFDLSILKNSVLSFTATCISATMLSGP